MNGATETPYRVLFLCTGNSARSILAESVLRRDGAGRFDASSAGSRPTGAVNPFALAVLEEAGYPTQGLRSKNWEEFARPGAPAADLVITVCDSAAGESCPIWPGHPVTAHWGLDDPAAVQGTDADKRAAFAAALRHIGARIARLVELPIEALDEAALRAQLRSIGRLTGASAGALAPATPDDAAARTAN